MFAEILGGKDSFSKFYEASSKNIKLDIHEDAQNCSRLAELLTFHPKRKQTGRPALRVRNAAGVVIEMQS